MICDDGYVTLQSYECLNACITNYLNQHSIPIKTSDVFLEGDDLDVVYTRKGGTWDISVGIYKSNFDFLRKADIFYEHGFFDLMQDGKSFLFDRISQNLCLSIRAVSDCLTYNPVFSQTEGAPHFINLIGMDDKGEQVCISDGDLPTFKPSLFQDWVDLNMIMDAWYGMRGEYIILHPKKDDVHLNTIKKSGTDKLYRLIRDYLEGGCNKALFRKVATGRQAILTLFDDLQEYSQRMKNDIGRVALDMNYQLRINGFLISKRYISHKIQDLNLDAGIVNPYSDLVNRWSAALLHLIKAGKSKRTEDFTKLNEKVKTLCQEEDNLLQHIQRAL